ncbi:MAG: hypothetical protein ED559_06225 [Phycisphaera sp.]|nr:MAG: hypothetical protein ED559_06225 [Phycisphaera sp.]
MHKPSFWTAFEESSEDVLFDATTKTQTRAREEPDQYAGCFSDPTKTLTATREEDDQDANQHGLGAFPRVAATETQTITKTREESDQDPVRFGLAALPRATAVNTQTMTEVRREECDQDAQVCQLAGIPRLDGAHA